MSKVKIKAVKDKEMVDMFNQMLGAAGKVNMEICYPKYITIKNIMMNVIELLESFASSPLFANKLFADEKAEIMAYVIKARKDHSELFYMDFTNHWNINMINERDHEQFSEQYEYIKKCQMMNDYIGICDALVPFNKHFKDVLTPPEESVTEVRYNTRPFITSPGPVIPFPFTSLDFKFVLNFLDVNKEAKMTEYIMIVLCKIYNITYKLYKTHSSPDIDIDRFVEVVMNNISEVKKQIPRCDKAFNKIIKSVHLLKDNFGKYYKDLVETKNSGIIMENFILDVAKDTSSVDPEVSRQFRSIISHYRKLAGSRAKDPRVKAIFDKLEDQIHSLDKYENLSSEKQDGEDNTADVETEAAPPPEKTVDEKRMEEARINNMKKTAEELANEIEGLTRKPASKGGKK